MERNLVWLYTGRALRSFTTAFLTVVFPLYLSAAHYSSAAIGAVLTLGGAATALMVAVVGLAGDRWGRRQLLMALGALGAIGGVVMALSPSPVAVTLASGLAGVGRGGGAGSGGSWGPVFPAEQPLVAGSVRPERRTAAFGTLSSVGVLAGAAGSLVAWWPDRLHAAGWSWLQAYRAVFLLGAVLSAAIVLATLPIRERPAAAAPAGTAVGLSTRQLLGRLGLTNALNGLGFGFLGPLLTYWFHVRYGVGPGQLGILYMLVNLVTALPYLGAARLAGRLGLVRAVTVTRAVSVALLLVMAWMPSFVWAGTVFALRMAVNSLGLPARQSYVMAVAHERWRGTVLALSSLPSQVTAAVSPVIGGVLMGVLVDTPLYGAALFMAANLVAYYYAFRDMPAPEEVGRPRPSAGGEVPAKVPSGMGTGSL